MKEISTDEYIKIQNASLRNILAKVASGKVPTRQEWDFLNEARESGEDVPALDIEKLPKTTTKYTTMFKLIMEQFNLSERKSKQWLAKLEHLKTGEKWPVRDVLGAIQERKDAATGGGGLNNDLKRQLLQEQVDMLRIKRMGIEGLLIEIDDVAAEISCISTAYGVGMEQFISYVSAEFSDPHAVSVAQKIANSITRKIKKELLKYEK